jgi:undecaprenyl-diphosphatase
MYARTTALFKRMDEREVALCLFLNRFTRLSRIEHFFAVVSRLGNGVFWYSIIAALPLIYGKQAMVAVIHMLSAALAGLGIYKFLKPRVFRERPFVTHTSIHLGAVPLDKYSFPSGHTLHAVSFTLIGMDYYPELVWLMGPFAVLVALSRVILGLHYPSDVLAGAGIGALLAATTLHL